MRGTRGVRVRAGYEHDRSKKNYLTLNCFKWGSIALILLKTVFKKTKTAQTLFIAVSYIDRFLSRMTVQSGKLQLLGVAALMLACKYEEIWPPSICMYACKCSPPPSFPLFLRQPPPPPPPVQHSTLARARPSGSPPRVVGRPMLGIAGTGATCVGVGAQGLLLMANPRLLLMANRGGRVRPRGRAAVTATPSTRGC